MSRRGLTVEQIQHVLQSTPLDESDEEEFDCDSDDEYCPPLNQDSSDNSDDCAKEEQEISNETTNTDSKLGKCYY